MHHVAVLDGTRATGIVACHAPQRALGRGAYVYRKPDAVWLEPGIEVIEHDAWFHRHCHGFEIEIDNAVQVLAVVQDQGRSAGLTALQGSAATRHQWCAQFSAAEGRVGKECV